MTLAGRLVNSNVVIQEGALVFDGGILRNEATGQYAQRGPISGSGDRIENAGRFLSGDASFAPRIFTIATRFDNDGTLHVFRNTTLRLSGPIDQFDPAAGSLSGGTWVIDGTLTLGAGQPLTSLGGSVDVGPTGRLVNLPANSAGGFLNNGVLKLEGGSYRFGGEVTSNGTLHLGPAASIAAPRVTVNGPWGGTGSINGQVINRGVFKPGRSPGSFSITGDFTQSDAARFEAELAGTTAGTQHDQLAVTGSASLDGTLALALIDGFVPAYGDDFTILSASSRTGRFSRVEGVLPPGTQRLALATVYDADGVRVVATLPGDASADLQVNGTDFALLAGNFGKTGQFWGTGDFNGDGAVNGSDFALLAGNFGRRGAAAAAAADAAAADAEAFYRELSNYPALAAATGVPEPGAGAVAGAIAAAGLLARRRRAAGSRARPAAGAGRPA
jgi:hypothetical protein